MFSNGLTAAVVSVILLHHVFVENRKSVFLKSSEFIRGRAHCFFAVFKGKKRIGVSRRELNYSKDLCRNILCKLPNCFILSILF